MSDSEIAPQKPDIRIYTLGKFFIMQEGTAITESSSRSRRMWEIFKFLLSNRGKAFTSEEILSRLWPNKDYNDPGSVLRTQMFRLRQSLNQSYDSKPSLTDNLVFRHGTYSWEDKIDYWLDVHDFENTASEARQKIDDNPEEAISLYKKAIELYRGEYLPESSFTEWIAPMRTYYQDLYLNSLYDLISLLKKGKAYQEIIKLTEQALNIEYFEENIHIQLIEALLATGATTRARAHYNEATSAFYRELGIKPSDTLKNLYRLSSIDDGSFELDLGTIQEGLKGQDVVNGAYLCDAELFRYFYKLERLRCERSGKTGLLCLFTITDTHFKMPSKELLDRVMNNLQESILDSLRKGDLVTRWNKAQYLMLLPGLNREQATSVMKRIENNYYNRYNLEGLELHKKIEPLLPLSEHSHYF